MSGGGWLGVGGIPSVPVSVDLVEGGGERLEQGVVITDVPTLLETLHDTHRAFDAAATEAMEARWN